MIGRGGFHIVFKATRKYDNYACCIRISLQRMFMLSDKDRFGYEESVRVQKSLKHPLIVGIIDDFIDSEGF